MSKDIKVTVKRIAELTGVSTATVSRVLNHKTTVNEDTRRKILEVMEELNANASAPSSNPASRTILLFVPDFTNPFNALVIEGIQQSACNNHYRVFILQSKEKQLSFEDYDEAVKNHSFAGIILLSSATNQKLLELLTVSCPIVMCSEYCDVNGISFVSTDDVSAARKATEYLISCGCRKIALINFSLQFRFSRYREQGYVEALHRGGLKKNEDWIVRLSSISYSLAYSYTLSLLAQPSPPDAIFAVSDVFAVAAIHAIQKKGLRVPDDISVIGFDNIELSAMTNPPLTTIEQPGIQMGHQACELLIERIHNPRTAKKRIIMDTELIVRESTTNFSRLLRDKNG
ncbi:MAG: LacI family DNA-binding transcriptional regulator [Spirochaetaceae bacterium]|jgi:DNA-binding LacI/PurR family transcriptional regulator|nr:LacI family DNA-binding transcriptional regulator [Spirochaetaceae bacterium]